MRWTTDLDRLLLSASEKGGTNREIALAVSAKTGYPFTEDQVRNRLKRVREQIDLDTAVESVPDTELPFAGQPEPEDGFIGFRLGFWDIEATGLSAIMGRLLCVSIADSWGNVTTRRSTDFPQSSVIDDSGLAEWARDELEKYDILVGWYSTGYDIGMLQARLARWGKRYMRSDLLHLDPIYKARGGRYGMKIGSSKLDNVAKFFRTSSQKTEIDWDVWQLAGMGDEAAMDEVVEHCEADVLVTRQVFNHLKGLISVIHR